MTPNHTLDNATRRTPQAIGYLRVSTERQADSGLGLEAQREAVAAAAGRLGMPLGGVFTDAGLSGSLEAHERPGLLDAITALRRGDVLLVAKRDRLGRDVIAVAMIERLVEKRGARIVSAAGEGSDSNDPTSQLLRRILDAFNEYERLVIRARTRSALRAKRRKGERAGAVPFGFELAEDGRTLAPRADEQRVLGVIHAQHAAGRSLRAIAEDLNTRGLRTRAGSAWCFQYVRGVLQTQARAAA